MPFDGADQDAALGEAVPTDLVRAARRSDERAWRVLFHRYQPAVTAYCLACANGRRDVALDWTQEIFALAAANLGQLDDDARFAGWLFTIARRHCLRRIAQSRQEQERTVPLELLLAGDAVAGDLSSAAEREAWAAAVGQACQAVENEEHRRIVVAHYVNGEKTRDIAERLGQPHGTVTVTLMRFRERLKRQLLGLLSKGELP